MDRGTDGEMEMKIAVERNGDRCTGAIHEQSNAQPAPTGYKVD